MHEATISPITKSANLVFSRLLVKIYNRFPVPFVLHLQETSQKLEAEITLGEEDFSSEEVVVGSLYFLREEGFIRYDDTKSFKEDFPLYNNCRLTKRGLALMTGHVPGRFQKSSVPSQMTLIEFLNSHTALDHLDLVGSVLSDAFVRH